MATSDKQFDSQFDKVANLVRYPWVGNDYTSASKRVLIMGDSHYTIDGNTKEFCQEEYEMYYRQGVHKRNHWLRDKKSW